MVYGICYDIGYIYIYIKVEVIIIKRFYYGCWFFDGVFWIIETCFVKKLWFVIGTKNNL